LSIVKNNIAKYNPAAVVIDAESAVTTTKPHLVERKKVLVVEDGPTLTHGGMTFGAGTIAARRLKAKIVDPRPYAKGSIKQVFKKYPKLKNVLPAMGYGKEQTKELQDIINAVPCDVVVAGTPIDLRKVIKSKKPIVRIRYELQEVGTPTLSDILDKLIEKMF
jgi:predicted GTPase